MVLTKETWKLANSTGIFGQHSWSGLLGDEFKLPVGRISATKKTPFVPMWPSTFGFLGFYGWNHGDWPHGNPAKKQVAKAKNLVKHFPFIDVWWYAQWKRCSRYFYELQQQSATFLTNSHFFEVLPVFVACPAPAAAIFCFPAEPQERRAAELLRPPTWALPQSHRPCRLWRGTSGFHGFDVELSNEKRTPFCCLGSGRGWNTTQLYGDYNKPL